MSPSAEPFPYIDEHRSIPLFFLFSLKSSLRIPWEGPLAERFKTVPYKMGVRGKAHGMRNELFKLNKQKKRKTGEGSKKCDSL
jgi:hypothetical protein